MYDFLGFIRSRNKRREQVEAEHQHAVEQANLRRAWASRDVPADRRLSASSSANRSADDNGWANSPMNPTSPSGMILSPLSPFSDSGTGYSGSSDCSPSSSSSDSGSSSCSGGSD